MFGLLSPPDTVATNPAKALAEAWILRRSPLPALDMSIKRAAAHWHHDRRRVAIRQATEQEDFKTQRRSDLPVEVLRTLGLAPLPSIFPSSGAPPAAQSELVNQRQAELAEVSNLQLGQRRDAPRIGYTTGARRPDRVGHLDADDKERLLDALKTDFHAPSSVSTQASLRNTWCKMHARWFGEDSRPFPTWPLAVQPWSAR